MNLFEIGWGVIAPIFLMMGAGWAVQRWLGLDVRTLTRLNFWILVPALLWVKIVESKLAAPDLWLIILHFALLFGILWALSWWSARWVGGGRFQSALTASVLFYNSGNYGIPVAQLAFNASSAAMQFAVAVQAIVMMLQNITNFTVGLALHDSARPNRQRFDTLIAIFKLPMIYTLVSAWAWRWMAAQWNWSLPLPVDRALHAFADALVPIALVTLGAQMANLKSFRFSLALGLCLVLRLLIGPLLSWGIVSALGITGALAQSLIVSSSFPTAVNSALLAVEFDNEADFAAASVFYSTLLSAVTVSIVIYLVKIGF